MKKYKHNTLKLFQKLILIAVALIGWLSLSIAQTAIANSEIYSPRKDICSDVRPIEQCLFPIRKYPIARIVNVVHAGIGKHACVDKMANFKWPVGVYCPKSEFCGFGINTNRDYRDDFPNVVEPTRELCEVLINSKMTDCDSVEILLDDAKIIQTPYSCARRGVDYCFQFFASCVDVTLGFECDSCLLGATVESSRGGLKCRDVNECVETQYCAGPITISCQNYPLSYNCICQQGYRHEQSQYGDGCTDINECLVPLACGVGSTNCTNTPGSFHCDCKEDFYFNGTKCRASFPNFDNILTCKVSGSCDFDSIYKDGINNRCVNEDCFVTNDFEGDIKNAQELLMTVNYTKGTLKLVLYFRGWNGYDLWLSDYNLIEAIAEVDGVERHLDPILITLMQLHNGILEQKLKLELRDTSGDFEYRHDMVIDLNTGQVVDSVDTIKIYARSSVPGLGWRLQMRYSSKADVDFFAFYNDQAALHTSEAYRAVNFESALNNSNQG
ncbi:uncharacterized protein LOC142348704 [Convolutriloba macropyga]|uniref:uncharacterized protein LOC142348704 n=1 Tax=Convolutriloba macropyga TaxID=536237 RepID=UPI003F520C8D